MFNLGQSSKSWGFPGPGQAQNGVQRKCPFLDQSQQQQQQGAAAGDDNELLPGSPALLRLAKKFEENPDYSENYSPDNYDYKVTTIRPALSATPGRSGSVAVDATASFELTRNPRPDAYSTGSTEILESASAGLQTLTLEDLMDEDEDEDPDFAESTTAPPFADLSYQIRHEFKGVSGDSPTDFTIQLLSPDPDEENALDDLKYDMTNWYKNYYLHQDSEYTESYEILPGHYYAVRSAIHNGWVRCWVDSFLLEGVESNNDWNKNVLVELIDYGIVEIVRQRHILPLRAKYLQLPVQAYRGKLNVLEPSGGWGSAIIRQFEMSFEGGIFSGVITAVSDDLAPYRTITLMLFLVDYMYLENGERVEQEILFTLEGQLKYGFSRASPVVSAYASVGTECSSAVASYRMPAKIDGAVGGSVNGVNMTSQADGCGKTFVDSNEGEDTLEPRPRPPLNEGMKYQIDSKSAADQELEMRLLRVMCGLDRGPRKY